MTREELLKAIMKLDRWDLEQSMIPNDYASMEKHYIGDYIEYEALIDLINTLYEDNKYLDPNYDI